MYSQNFEEAIVKKYFVNETGTLLDIGANDGKTLSNSLALIEAGWNAVLIEPCEHPYEKLCDLHTGNEKVYCYNIALDTEDGEKEINSMGDHLGTGDTDLLSTLKKPIEKWAAIEFHPEKVICRTLESFLKFCPIKKFDFITIDAEELDYDILIQMDLQQLGCRCVCIEHNGNSIGKFILYAQKFKMKEIYRNAENIIFVL